MAHLSPRNGLVLLAFAGLVGLAVAVPAIGADPAPPADPPGQAGKADKGPELEATLSGVVEQTADDKGRPTYTITVDGQTWELSAGPKWFWGDANPLAAVVGQTVDVAGTYHEGETELDVETVNGQPIREPGKPPWAGGPKVVGERHPGWKDDGERAGNGLGPEGAPGHNRDDSGQGEEGSGG